MNPVCPYCTCDSSLVTGLKIYPHRPDLYTLSFYLCEKCDAYVGTHKGTLKPLGRLANAELREWKRKAHAAFDPLWKNGSMSRTEAYSRLSTRLGIPMSQCHVGQMDVDMCKKIVAVCGGRT